MIISEFKEQEKLHPEKNARLIWLHTTLYQGKFVGFSTNAMPSTVMEIQFSMTQCWFKLLESDPGQFILDLFKYSTILPKKKKNVSS